jgi:hypothetical protein
MLINGREYKPEGILLSFFSQSGHTKEGKILKEGISAVWKIKNQRTTEELRLRLYLPSSYGKIFWTLQEHPDVIQGSMSLHTDKNLNQFECVYLTLKNKPEYEFKFTSQVIDNPA